MTAKVFEIKKITTSETQRARISVGYSVYDDNN